MNQRNILFETDPLLKQSVEALGMPEPLSINFTEKKIGAMAAGGLLMSSVIVGVVSENNTADAAFDNRVVPGQAVCVNVGNPGDILLMNATVAEPEAPGFATVGPTGANWRAYSTNNYNAGGAIPNFTATKIGPDGKVCMTPSQTTHLIGDAIGFLPGGDFTPYKGKAYPTRIFDTRQGGSKTTPGQAVCVNVGNPGDILLMNATVAEPEAPGFATVGPTGANWRAYSTNNYNAGGAIPNFTATKIGPDGKVCMTPSQTTHLIGDAIGFLPGGDFTPYKGKAYPTRIFDTRQGGTPPAGVPGNFVPVYINGNGVRPEQIEDIKCTYSPVGSYIYPNGERQYVFDLSYFVKGLVGDPDLYDGVNTGEIIFKRDYINGVEIGSGPQRAVFFEGDSTGAVFMGTTAEFFPKTNSARLSGLTILMKRYFEFQQGTSQEDVNNALYQVTDLPCRLVERP